MQYTATTPDAYIAQLPKERQAPMEKLRGVILAALPNGFQECISYGMIGYVVPHELYPNGYHCDTKLPLPFMNIASQKNFIGFYHMGIYAKPELYTWFVEAYPNHSPYKLDMGKSCVRFKKIDQLPYQLIEELVKKMTVEDWISTYENTFRK
jgi:uncharacterized protein YdhG (YjbR/CyaY superfamily)